MSLLDKVTAEAQPLLDAAFAIAEKISNHDELVVQTKIITEATHKVSNLLTTGNANDATPVSPRGDSFAGQLKAQVVSLVKNRREALDKGDGMNAMRDLEHVANALDHIKKLVREIKDDASSGGSKTTVSDPNDPSLPKPVNGAVVDESGTRGVDKYENLTMTLGVSIKPNSPVNANVVKEETTATSLPPPSPAKLPTVVPAKESNTGSVSISSPSKASTQSNDSASSASSNPNIPAWQQKLLAKKKLGEDLTPKKTSSSAPSSPAPSSSPAKWQAPKEEKKAEPVKVEPVKVEPVKVEPPKPVVVEPPKPVVVEAPKPVVVEVKKEEPAPAPVKVEPPKPPVVEESVTLSFSPPPKEEPKPVIEVVSQSPIVVKEASAGKPVVLNVDLAPPKENKVTSEVKLTQTSVPAAKPSITKVNESGSALSPSLQKNIGIGRMSGVKTLSVTLAASSAAIDKCNEAVHNSSIRWIALKIEKEQLELVTSGNATGSPSADLDTMKGTAKDGEALYFFFRYKDSGDAQWALISWIPESSPVKQRMIYASSVESTKVMVGAERVDKLATFNNLNQFKWDEFAVAGIKLKNEKDFLAEENDAALPFSEIELAKRQVEREERQVREEMKGKATAASGFHTVAFPLDSKAEEAIRGLAAGQHSWVHLSLDSSFKTIEHRGSSTPSGISALAELLHKTEPQFYLYSYKDNVPVLIYMCPEKGPTVKNKMVYSTCKSSLADSILTYGFSDIKKLDIRAPDELTASELDDAYVAKAAFKPSESGGGGDYGARSSKGSAGAARYGGVSAFGGLGAAVANKAMLKKGNQ